MYSKLLNQAKTIAQKAYAPYSQFHVGAALQTKNGKVYFGCNIENQSYPVTCCAERVALFSAIASGETDFMRIAIVGGENENYSQPCFPCGMCRQALAEFCNETFEIILAKGTSFEVYTLGELLPHTFSFGGSKL